MRIPLAVAQELDDFLRYLALTPHELQRYSQDPEAFIATLKLSEAAADCLRDNGLEALKAAVQDKRDAIMDHPDSWKRSEFTRDRSVKGYGGAVVKKGPAS
ncbi:MAG: hypothetical protein WD602_04330 [Actinomycetota bacterium]